VPRKLYLVALIASLASGPAWGQTVVNNGYWLYEQCSKPLGDASYVENVGLCTRVIQGVFNTLVNSGRPLPDGPCFPGNVTLGQLKDVVTRFLAVEPERRQYPATSLIVSAFVEAYPCER
jgi:hypothetical protein